ncbi:hypothetical protein KIPB_003866 [Kipferlia bialata]|uniref:CRIB domain-containing protein n=1 Tax=Kipferlia bialata TaxID=797122 RepID=A0A9K3CU41_9EUKA|nr:hypothetical protein KIPB_003866 [Kipferlia bialata]|eukprot:g3866.t1
MHPVLPPGKLRESFSHGHEEDNTQQLVIGAPTDFQHEHTIGFDYDTGVFDLSAMPEELLDMFRAAGIKDEELQQPEYAQFLFDQIDKAVKK